MRGILRLGLMMLLAAAAGVGIAWGEEWKDYTPSTPWAIKWQYSEIEAGKTCRIKPKDKATISGKVTIPDQVGSIKVVEIAKEAFYECSKLTGVSISEGVKTIGGYAFYGCSDLTAVSISESVKTIGDEAFYKCIKLAAVEIPNSVTKIGMHAFYGCKELTEVSIPSSVRAIGDYAFSGCTGLTAFEMDGDNASYSQDGGVIFTKDRNTLVSYPGGRKGAYEIPGSVMGIRAGAFSGCDGLTAVVIPSSVKLISGFTFSGCTELTAVTIPDGMTVIGPFAFQDCNKLKEVTIPGSVKRIYESAFKGCGSLNAVYVYRPVDQEFTVDATAFLNIGSQATLYMRPGMKAKIQNEEWYKNKFKELAEFYVVTFNANGGTPTPDAQTVVKDGTATVPKAPTKEGYIVEWQLDGAKYDFSAKVTKDITLVAVWKKKEESTPDNPETAVESVQLAAVRAVRNPMGEALELEGMERAARVEVYSVVGARVHAEALRGEPRVVIDARGWASGVYVVKVEASDGEKTLRVVK